MIKSEILVPLLNANEPEARLIVVHVKDGQAVKKGALLFTIETTKAASDIEASQAGFVRILVAEGDTLAVGDRLAVITETAMNRWKSRVGATYTLPLQKCASPNRRERWPNRWG